MRWYLLHYSTVEDEETLPRSAFLRARGTSLVDCAVRGLKTHWSVATLRAPATVYAYVTPMDGPRHENGNPMCVHRFTLELTP